MPRARASNWIYSRKVEEDENGKKKVVDVLAGFKKGFRCPGGEVVIFTDSGWAWQMSAKDFRNASEEFDILLQSHPGPLIKSQRTEKLPGAGIRYAWKLGPPAENFEDHRIRTLKPESTTARKNKISLEEVLIGDPELEKAALLYDTMFRIMCSSEPQFQDKLSLDISMDQKFIQEAVAVLTIACSHGAAKAVSMVLENHFLRLGQRLWTYVAANPAFWLIVATRIKSTILFKDALCHAVGLIDSRQFIDREEFLEENDPQIKDVCLLIEEKIRDLSKLKIKAEEDLLRHFPAEMYHPAALNYTPDRSVYSGQIYLWMTRSLVQQWFVSCISKDFHHRAEDGGMLMYQTIRKGGDAYLTDDSLGSFNQAFVMSGRANSKPFHDALKSHKETAKTCLNDLMVDYSQSQKNKDAVLGYLTCMTVNEHEYPWIRVPDARN
ncbi:hypothetical protein BJ875DRAFT_417190 [Amylocarpus encephaloides]|uniref:Uncharacterized protein n=1 Tax=Amylocarpus encephaloides TaxID=45428 RepID=A0A9P7YQK4_9HELO|nr:hypothetical protein BJ875DRAFT_417190 [Amylocarpus encephaloides]